ncbi:alpha/beta hydrolase [Pararhizobium sp. YC-54]|uniref:alpha/beta fold hydrolase n=1 Tax=Pararhizobium sp. YC-54 TaxID=2986920 RepID=UPI0021F76C1F|nr:alpha/beta hydrolase [Pararhizobium sp. YC-54]MCV9999841.1 alpha/beta hydrolase [Pararhizobium sp. YC-54]
MFAKVETLQSPSGAALAWRHWPASGPHKGVLIVAHGLAEHSARYARFAEVMAAHGFNVYAHDHRGHGATRAADAPLGRYAQAQGAAKVVDDVAAMRAMAASRHPGLPVILFGHSMGGLIALNAAEENPGLYDGLAVWNSNFNPGLAGRAAQAVLAVEKMLKGSDVPSGLLSKLTFGAWAKSIPERKTDYDWLSHDPVEVAKYIDDPLCGFDASVSMWIDLFKLTFAGASPDRLAGLPQDLPVHLVGGGQDPATTGGQEIRWLERRMRAAGLKGVTTIVYPAMRHETLNETERDGAMRDFAGWCLSVVERRT